MKTFKDVLKDQTVSTDLWLLVVGRVGQGKSTLTNSIVELEEEIAEEGAHAKICTSTIHSCVYPNLIPGIDVTVIDSPGLQDTHEREQSYIQAIKNKCQEVSLVLYCIKMTDQRFTNDEKITMQKLYQAFGPKFWERVMFVLTFANDERVDREDDSRDKPAQEPVNDEKELMKTRFVGRFELRVTELKELLLKVGAGFDSNILKNIKFIPAGWYKKDHFCRNPSQLPDRDNWLKDLLKSCHKQIKNTHKFSRLSLNDSKLNTSMMHNYM